MSQDRPISVVIYEKDLQQALLFGKMVESLGYTVRVYSAPTDCPIYASHTCTCPQTNPCADIVLIDYDMSHMNGIELLELQRTLGCKTRFENKAIMSTSLSVQLKEIIASLGCQFFCKPLRRIELKSWLDACATRLA